MTRADTRPARLRVGAICLRVRSIRRARKAGIAVGGIKTVGITLPPAAHVTSGHATRVAAQPTMSELVSSKGGGVPAGCRICRLGGSGNP